MVRRICLLSLIFVVRLGAAQTYEFELNGKPVQAEISSLNGTPESPAPGDVAEVERFAFVLDAPGKYVLRTPDADRGRLLRVRSSDRVHAAIWLARLGDAGSNAELQTLPGTLAGEEKTALEKALAGAKE